MCDRGARLLTVVAGVAPLVCCGLALAAATPSSPTADRPRPPNVLLVAFDDLNDWIRPLDSSAPIVMPHLDALTRQGLTFRRAYCAAPQCNPSRTALFSGLRPTTSGIYDNNSDWRRVMPDRVMLPRYFRQHGYVSVGAGKIFHHVDPHFHDAASFDDYLPFFTDVLPGKKLNALTAARTPDGDWEPLAPTFDWGPSPTQEKDMLDVRSVSYAEDFLRRASADRPFFLTVGFFRPHLPYFAPARYFAAVQDARIPLPPTRTDDLADVPTGGQALMKRWARMFRAIQQAPDPAAKWHEAVNAYAAGAAFADEQLGRLVAALDRSGHRQNTIIVVWSDHGYHLGEKQHWTKFVLWEKATRVPLVVVAPGVTAAGSVCDRPVSLVDLYPTLLDLCRLPPRNDLDGVSLVPLLRAPTAAADRPALMTEGRGNHAVRTDRWRYIRYADGGEELYDHSTDPHEWTNLAGDPRQREVLAAHRRWLPVSEANPAPDFQSPNPTKR